MGESLGNQTKWTSHVLFLYFVGKIQPIKEMHERFLDLHIRGICSHLQWVVEFEGQFATCE